MIRPGIESILNPMEGIVNEWITSFEVVKTRIFILIGITSRWSTSNNRNCPFSNISVLIMNESNFKFKNWGYSYDQYHCRPILLIVRLGDFISSVIYNKVIDGIANKNKINNGIIVQTVSKIWWSIILFV